ncbi:adenylate/guanylate cyclase domain-containing protein [Microbaculum marinum]|uniref:adenylate/guanylate cyclase domain-containing protein n=1 Tax=Microbaculum marinum TaxID=1764581 RepID=UPI00362388A1
MRIGVRLALTAFVVVSIAVTAVIVNALWWRAAQTSSRQLAATINAQIVSAVEDEIQDIATQGRSAYWAIRTLFYNSVLGTREADKREFVFLSQLQAQPSISWIALGWPDGDFFAAHKLGDEQLEMMEIDSVDGARTRRVDRYQVYPNDIEFRERVFEPSDFLSTDQPWFLTTIGRDGPHWVDVVDHPTGPRPALVFAGPVQVFTRTEAVLAVMIEHDRLSRFLAGLEVGQSGAAFILTPRGDPIAVPDPKADELMGTRFDLTPGLLAVARRAIADAMAPMPAGATRMKNQREMRVTGDDGEAYGVTLTPLAYAGWTLATVIPEREFLGPIERTMRRLVVGMLALAVAAAGLAAWLGRRWIAGPLGTVAGELNHIERFELENVRYHRSRLAELDELSGAIHRMAGGLSAFRKYLPADLVRILVHDGIEARPGGARRELTILFADIEGFTGLSERLGEEVVPVLGRYLDAMSNEIQAQRGTVDKFIGDAVMAFWGAPHDNAGHARDACRAALNAYRAVRENGIADDRGRPLAMRIGINTGTVLVGNIGSERRLNYTVIGDPVNVASRLEGASKLYGTAILIGERTRELAGEAIVARRLDKVAVYGRAGGTAIYELLGMAEEGADMPQWAALYEEGLACYSWGDFETAIGFFRKADAARSGGEGRPGGDPPSRLLIERCRAFVKAPPPPDWDGTTPLMGK